jgi:hypothetical protein
VVDLLDGQTHLLSEVDDGRDRHLGRQQCQFEVGLVAGIAFLPLGDASLTREHYTDH